MFIIEILTVVFAVTAAFRIAEHDARSGTIWAALTLGACFVAIVLIPLPYLRVFAALILILIAMMLTKTSVA